jgi:hypothetical protein
VREVQQGSTAFPLEFLLVSSADHTSPVTGATPSVTLSKNGGSFAAQAGTVSEIGSGWYKIGGSGLATDTNTLGSLIIHVTAAGADTCDAMYTVVPWNPFDAVRLGLTALPNVAQGGAGCLLTSGTGTGQVNTTGGTVSASLSTSERDALANDILDLANGIESGETLRQTLRLLRAVLAGVSTEASGQVIFKRKDGTATALTVVHTGTGSRTSSTVGSL